MHVGHIISIQSSAEAHLGWFRFLNRAVMNLNEQVPCMLWCLPRGTAGLCDSSIFSFLKACIYLRQEKGLAAAQVAVRTTCGVVFHLPKDSGQISHSRQQCLTGMHVIRPKGLVHSCEGVC